MYNQSSSTIFLRAIGIVLLVSVLILLYPTLKWFMTPEAEVITEEIEDPSYVHQQPAGYLAILTTMNEQSAGNESAAGAEMIAGEVDTTVEIDSDDNSPDYVRNLSVYNLATNGAMPLDAEFYTGYQQTPNGEEMVTAVWNGEAMDIVHTVDDVSTTLVSDISDPTQLTLNSDASAFAYVTAGNVIVHDIDGAEIMTIDGAGSPAWVTPTTLLYLTSGAINQVDVESDNTTSLATGAYNATDELAVSPDGTHLVLTSSDAGEVKVFALPTEEVATITEVYMVSIAGAHNPIFAPDLNTFGVMSDNATPTIYFYEVYQADRISTLNLSGMSGTNPRVAEWSLTSPFGPVATPDYQYDY